MANPKYFAAFILSCLAATCFAATQGTITFDRDKPDQPPHDWETGVTGIGFGMWNVVADETAPTRPHVLQQNGVGTYLWAVLPKANIRDGHVQVRFKAVSGRIDQAAGLIWRFKDSNNYYIARANALENNVTIYHTTNGNRREFQRVGVEVRPSMWHTLRVDFKDQHFVVSFNQKPVIIVQDSTLSGTGAVGLWTKADSVVLFDDFTYDGQ